MSSDPFENIAKDAKKVLFPSREKRDKNTAQLGSFIEDITHVYKKYYVEGLSPMDAGDALVELSIAAVMKNEHHSMSVLYADSLKTSGKVMARALEQYGGSSDPKDWIMD